MEDEVSGVKFGTELFKRLSGKKPTRISLGHGSFLTFDFGRDHEEKIKTRSGGFKIIKYGEWHLWVYMCAWRIDKHDIPFVGSNDSRDLIQQKLQSLAGQKLKKASLLNDAFDAIFTFGDEYKLHLFSFQVTDDEQWMLFTPEKKVFVAGPNNKWSYHDSDQT